MHRGAGSILVLLAVVMQGFSLCTCRAEQLINPVAPHVHSSDGTGDPAHPTPGCLSANSTSPEFCDSHDVQAKELTGASPLVVTAVTSSAAVSWAMPCLGTRPQPAHGPTGSSGLRSRSLPLLI